MFIDKIQSNNPNKSTWFKRWIKDNINVKLFGNYISNQYQFETEFKVEFLGV
jgi:hypothetical protein